MKTGYFNKLIYINLSKIINLISQVANEHSNISAFCVCICIILYALVIAIYYLQIGKFTLQWYFCPFWHFSPFWLSMKVLCRNAWCNIFAFLYFNVVQFHVCLLSWHGMDFHFAWKSLAPSWSCALFCLTFLERMFCGSCTGVMCHSSCGMYIEWCCDCYNICRNWIMA